MTTKTIHRLKITNYKSIDSLELEGLSPFTVFAGPNGSGKSNFFDALDFVSLFVRGGLEAALRAHGGFANIHAEKRRAEHAGEFGFKIECDLPESEQADEGKLFRFHYSLTIHTLDQESPDIEEHMSRNGAPFLTRKKGGKLVIQGPEDPDPWPDRFLNSFPKTYSALLFFSKLPLARLLQNIGLYRIDPIGAKAPDPSNSDRTKLNKRGHNLARVLSRLERDEQVRETILEWMETIVPGLEKIQTEQGQLENETAISFKEQGIERRFPAHMVSDGTVYALSLLVAVLDLPLHGLTLIEEPERGLHPAAIRELIGLMQGQATPRNPIWLTTHSESVVRGLRPEELILVDKVDGRTRMKPAAAGGLTLDDLAPLGLDEAWLSNLLDGGLPW